MPDEDRIKEDIEKLRDRMDNLIQKKNNLLDMEVLKASMLLDDALNKYNKMRSKGKVKTAISADT